MGRCKHLLAPLVAAIAALALLGCSDDPSTSEHIRPTPGQQAPGAGTAGVGAGDGLPGGMAGSAAAVTPQGEGGRVSIGSTPLPCAVDAVLATSCRGCHGANPGLQSPMALMTHEDLTAAAISNPSVSVWALVKDRVHSGAAPMPPIGGGRPLLDSEMAVLDAWMDGGAVPGEVACPGSGGISDGKGIIDYTPPEADEVGECYEFYAHEHSTPGDTTPFQARAGGEYYTAFFFDVPFEGKKQALEFRFNSTPITHHILLYDTTEPASDYQVNAVSLGSHPNAPDLLAAWAVGQQVVQHMPQTVGMHLPERGGSHRFLVEVHYANYTGEARPDSSGIEVCTGKQLRPNTATVSWLGTELILIAPGAEQPFSGTCTPNSPEDIYIFRSFPHMHEAGVALSTEIVRRDGRREMLIDRAYDFNNQLMYDTPARIERGDRLETTCSYRNHTDGFIPTGFESGQEMCFNFVYAWPARALTSGISFTGSATPCLL